MRTRIFSLMMAVLTAGAIVAGCKKPEPVKEDPVITANPDKLQSTFEETVFEVNVTANCTWNISKTNAQGEAVDWVKCDVTSGNGDASFNIKVMKNEGAESRKATVTLYHDDTKAFIDINQDGNPNPNPEPPGPGPEPQPQYLELSFDFTAGGLDGWPTANDQSWESLKNCDSGCATDNGGTATANSHRRAQVTFKLNGGTYNGSKDDIVIKAEDGDIITIPAAPQRDGYKFIYWKGSKYYPGDKYTVDGDHTMTAQWEKTSDRGKSDSEDSYGNNGSGSSDPSGRGTGTGDSLDILVWLAVMLASLLALTAAAIVRRKSR